MPLSVQASSDGLTVIISITERFDSTLHHDFRQAFREQGEGKRSYVIDLSQTTYIDSSALGMLLMLREYAGGDDADIKLINCSPEIRRILTISNFERIFKVD